MKTHEITLAITTNIGLQLYEAEQMIYRVKGAIR